MPPATTVARDAATGSAVTALGWRGPALILLALLAPSQLRALEVAATFTIAHQPAVADLNGPLIDGSGHVATFLEGGGPVAIVDPSAATLTDKIQLTVAGVSVRIADTPDGGDERLDARVCGTGITKRYDASTGLLALTGVDTADHYQAVLRTLVYDNTAPHAHVASRRITVSVNDGTEEGPLAVSIVTVRPAGVERGGALVAAQDQ